MENYAIQEIASTMLHGAPEDYEALFLDCKIPYRDMAVVDNLLLAPLKAQWYNSFIARQQ